MKILAFIGILLLVILSLILLLLLFVSFTKFRIVSEILKTDDNQEVYVTLCFWNNLVKIPLIKKQKNSHSVPEKSNDTPKKDKPKKQKPQSKPKTPEEKAESLGEKIKSYIDLYYSIRPSAFKGIKRIKKHVKLEPLTLYINYGANDPAVTGITFGALQAILRPFMVILDEVFSLRPADVRFNPDFNKPRFDIYFQGIFHLRFVHIIMGLISIGFAYFKHTYKKSKKS